MAELFYKTPLSQNTLYEIKKTEIKKKSKPKSSTESQNRLCIHRVQVLQN